VHLEVDGGAGVQGYAAAETGTDGTQGCAVLPPGRSAVPSDRCGGRQNRSERSPSTRAPPMLGCWERWLRRTDPRVAAHLDVWALVGAWFAVSD
jgi:hypothetical protein